MADTGVVLSERGAVALEEIDVDAPEAGRGARPHRGDRRLPQRPARDRGGRLGSPATRCCSGTRAPARSRRSATGVTALAPGDRVVLGWKTACGRCAACLARARRASAGSRPRRAGRLLRRDGADADARAAHRDVRDAHRRPRGRRREGARRAARRAGVPDRLRRRDRRDVGARDGAGSGEGARVAVIGCGAVGLSVVQGARHRRRGGDPSDRPRRRAKARAGAAVRRDAHRARAGRLRLRRRRPPGDVRAGSVAARDRRHVRADRALAGGRDGERRSATALREARAHPRLARRRSPAARGLPAARRSGRSTASSTSPAWSRGSSPLSAWDEALDAMREGGVIRTVLTPSDS